MTTVRFTRRAERDLLEIGRHTLAEWGPRQAERYLTSLENCCRRLAAVPSSGRPCEEIRPGLRRQEQGRHVIFYRSSSQGILVTRILHDRMLPQKRLL